MLLSEFLELVDLGEDFLLYFHKDGDIATLLDMIEYIPYVDPELYFININTSDGNQIALECGITLLPCLIKYKGGEIVYKEWVTGDQEDDA